MAKEYDIHFRQHLTECDLVFYSLPYHDGIVVTNRLILNAELADLVMRQMFEVTSALISDAKIAQTFKQCFEQFNPALILDADVVFSVYKSLYPDNEPMLLDASVSDMFATAFTDVSNSMLLQAEVTGTQLALSAGSVSLPMVINAAVDTLKRDLLSPSVGIDLAAEVTDTSQIDYLNVDSGMVLDAVPPNLSYRLTTGGESEMQLAAMVIGTKLLHSLGAWYNGIAIDARVTGTSAVKNAEVQSGMILDMDAECVLNEIITPENDAIILGVDDIDMGLKRYRLLADLDDWTLEDMDDMTLDELDYVILA